MKKIYIAGPMRGHKFYNFPAFDAAEARLRRLGYDVVNPAAIDWSMGIRPETFPEDWDWNCVPECFDLKSKALECIQLISESYGLLLLEGWHESVGARAECRFAEWLNMPCLVETWQDDGILICFGSPT